jgi:propanol-preferring alcohol dehydrogenase
MSAIPVPRSMRAMRVHRGRAGLVEERIPVPEPAPGQVLLRVLACGVCRTDLHIVDGELAGGVRPVVPGHEIVGVVEETGEGATRFRMGERVGVPWLGWTCGECEYCRCGRENLCERAKFTGYDLDGGFAEYCVADERYCVALPAHYADAEAAPLLCAGLIGYRSYQITEMRAGEGRILGLYGFGAAAHILAQVAKADGRRVYALTRPGDAQSQAFARRLGVDWAGGSDETPPAPLDAAILFAPAGELVPRALAQVRKGGCVVCGGIHMSDIPSIPYSLLWGERRVQSVANLTRADGEAFMAVAGRTAIRMQVRRYALGEANAALEDLRAGRIDGAAVVVP